MAARGAEHEFSIQEEEAKGYGWVTAYCFACGLPFIGGFIGSPLQCRHCKAVSCQTCAANQAEWDLKFACTGAQATAKYRAFDEDMDADSVEKQAKEIPASVKAYHKAMMEKHDNLVDCINNLKAFVRLYHHELEDSIKGYHDAVPKATDSVQARGDPSTVPPEFLEFVKERLNPTSERLVEQATVALELTSQLRNAHSDQQDKRSQVAAHRPAHTVGPANEPVVSRIEVPGLPIFDTFVGGAGEIDVIRLLHKICRYCDDEEIEEGLCSRLSTVAEPALPQVEFLLPALTNIVLQSEGEMHFLTRELIRFCTMSFHFAIKFLWCIQTAWIRDIKTAERMQVSMMNCKFDSKQDERIARLLWLVMLAVTRGAEDRQGEYEVLSLAMAELTSDQESLVSSQIKETMSRSLGIADSDITSKAKFIPVGVRVSPEQSVILFDTRMELKVASEPFTVKLVVSAGRYMVRVENIDDSGGAKKVAAVTCRVERPSLEAETIKQDVSSADVGEIRFEAPDVEEEHTKVALRVEWKDLHQIRFSIRVTVSGEPIDFITRTLEPVFEEEVIVAKEDQKGGDSNWWGKARKMVEKEQMERALRLSLEEHKKSLKLKERATTIRQFRYRLLQCEHKFFEALVEISRHLTVFRSKNRSSKEELNSLLRKKLTHMNRCIPKGLYLPFGTSLDPTLEVMAIAAEECQVLQTPYKVHYQLLVEVKRSERMCSRVGEEALESSALHGEVPYICGEDHETHAKSSVEKHRQPLSFSSLCGSQVADTVVVPAADEHPQASQNDMFPEHWSKQKKRIQTQSKHSYLSWSSAWDCCNLIVKSHDDLRQDQLAAQLLSLFDSIFKAAGLSLPLQPYAVVATTGLGTGGGGLLETLTDSISIDNLKKKSKNASLEKCFKTLFGTPAARLRDAKQAFVQSMAAYSVFCYVLHVKDRHNGNIMLCRNGAVAHVDFGIMLNVKYAKDVIEMKIKLSSEYVEVWFGVPVPIPLTHSLAHSIACMRCETSWPTLQKTLNDQVMKEEMEEFKRLCVEGYLAIRRESKKLLTLLEISKVGAGTGLPCLEGDAVEQVGRRLKLDGDETQASQHMIDQVNKAAQNVRTEILDYVHDWTHSGV